MSYYYTVFPREKCFLQSDWSVKIEILCSLVTSNLTMPTLNELFNKIEHMRESKNACMVINVTIFKLV